MQHFKADSCLRPAPPGADVKRLFDLVNCKDEKLRLAFYYAMRDTVVARDLDQAARIAYGQDRRWRRVVTVKVGAWRGSQGRMVGAWWLPISPAGHAAW